MGLGTEEKFEQVVPDTPSCESSSPWVFSNLIYHVDINMVIIMAMCVLLGLVVGFQIGHCVGFNAFDWKHSISVWAAQGLAAGLGIEVPHTSGSPFGTTSPLVLGGVNPQLVQWGTVAVIVKESREHDSCPHPCLVADS